MEYCLHTDSHCPLDRPTRVAVALVRCRTVAGLVFLGLAPPMTMACASPPANAMTAVAAPPRASQVSSAGPPTPSDSRGPSSDHADAIGRLLDASWGARTDRRRAIALPLPDAPAWTHVKYWGVTTLAGWRYGDEHHVAVAAFTFTVPSTVSLESCASQFQVWGRERAKTFDIVIGEATVRRVPWTAGGSEAKPPSQATLFALDAERRSLFGNTRYAAGYAVFAPWPEACLVIGLAIPEGEAPDAARRLRARLLTESLPNLVARPGAGRLALEAKSDIE